MDLSPSRPPSGLSFLSKSIKETGAKMCANLHFNQANEVIELWWDETDGRLRRQLQAAWLRNPLLFDEFIEPALRPGRALLLVEKRQPAEVEQLEEELPGELFHVAGLIPIGENDSKG